MKELKPFFLDFTEDEIQATQKKMGEILRTGQLILGKYTEEFEHLYAEYVGTSHAVSLNSATSALEVLCMLKNVSGKKIAVPSNTNFASCNSNTQGWRASNLYGNDQRIFCAQYRYTY